MTIQKFKKERGFIKMIILVVIGLFALKYFFNISVKDILDNSAVKGIISILKSLLSLLWQAILFTIDFLKVAIEKIKDFLTSFSK